MKKLLTSLSVVMIGSTASQAAVITTGNDKPTINVIDGFEHSDYGQFAVNNDYATGSGQTWKSSQSIKIDAISLAFKAFDFDANPDSWTVTLYTDWTSPTDITTGSVLWTESSLVPTGDHGDRQYVTIDFTAAEEDAIGILAAGQEYGIVLNGGIDSGAFPFILRTLSGDTDSYTNGSGIWGNNPTNVEDAYFAVQGTAVPEPSSALLLLSAASLATLQRRRR